MKKFTVEVPPVVTPPLVVPISESGMIDTAAMLHILCEIDLAKDEEGLEEEISPLPTASAPKGD